MEVLPPGIGDPCRYDGVGPAGQYPVQRDVRRVRPLFQLVFRGAGSLLPAARNGRAVHHALCHGFGNARGGAAGVWNLFRDPEMGAQQGHELTAEGAFLPRNKRLLDFFGPCSIR